MAQGYFDNYRIFRDPIHGFIKVYNVERDIINTPAFQRLRRIKQLGLTHLVYHGADHTRFAHSLGVMELATRVFEITVSKDTKGDKVLKWKEQELERNKVLLRLVALLHDIGHGPFSHSSEELFPDGFNHEQYSAKIIAEDTEISAIIRDLQESYNVDVTADNIINFIIGKEPEPFLQQIISGPLDTDKMDYLLRDSYYTGVDYGRFDLDRIINTLVVIDHPVVKSPALGIELGGLYAAEAMILSRYYMFLQVYFHEIRRAYDLHLTDFLNKLLPGGKYPEKVEDFINYDDYFVFHRVKEATCSKDEIGDLAKRIFYRKHFEKIIQHLRVRPSEKEINLFKDNYTKLKGQFPEVILDKAEDAPNKFEEVSFYLRNKDFSRVEDKYVEIDHRSDIIKELKPFTMYRLYAPDDGNLPEVKKEVERLKWEY